MANMKIFTAVALIAGIIECASAQWPNQWPNQWNGGGAAAMAGAGAGAFAGGFPFNFVGVPPPPMLPMPMWGGPATFPTIPMPSPADIANIQPGNGGDVHGMVMMSSSSSQRGPDGKVLKTGGTTALVNDNGQVHQVQFGDSPPTVASHSVQSGWMPMIVFPEIKMPKFRPIKMPKFPKMKMPKFHKIRMPHFSDVEIPDIPDIEIPDIPDIEIPDIPDIEIPDIPDIKIPDIKIPDPNQKNYVPSEGSSFVSISSISQGHSFDVNGKKKNAGRIEILINDNGKIRSEVIHFGDDGAKGKDGDDGNVEEDGKEREDGRVVEDEKEEENGKDGENRKEEDEATKKDQENEVDTGSEKNNVKETTLGDMDKYEIV